MPTSWRVLATFFGVFAASIIAFLVFATVARKENATGILKLSDGELRVLPPKPGVVHMVAVKEGQTVQRGDVLAIISTEQSLSGGGTVDARLLTAIESERQSLGDRLGSLNQSAPLEQRAMAERLDGVRHQIAELSAELPNREARLAAAQDAYAAGKGFFDNGTMSENDLRQRHYDLLAQQQTMGDFRAQIAQLRAQAAETAASLAKLPSDEAQTRASIQQEIVSLEEKRADADAQSGFVLTAEMAGTVTALQAVTGQAVEPAKPLMTLIPFGSVLQAEIYVPSRAIGFVRPGQNVRLLYDAFPHERFGSARGTVVSISSTVLRPDDVAAAVSVKEPVYRVLVTPDQMTVRAYGADIPLIPGMALSADIVLEDRSFLDLLFDPLIASRGRILGD